MDDAYFLYHSIGQYPGKTAELRAVMAEFAEVWGRADDGQWGWLMPKRARFIELWERLIKAPEGSLTTSENVTQALHRLLIALPEGHLRGKRVLVAGDCFPSNHFLLTKMQQRLGFTLDTVPLRQGGAHVEDEDFIEKWGPDVGLALITWVASTSSHRVNLEALVGHGRQMGSLIGVDVTQGIGLLPYDVMAPAVDFTVGSTLKWLCGTPGAGILHVAPELIATCQPELRGWFSQSNPFSWALDAFDYAPDIRRFDNGTPSCLSAVASVPALEWFAAQDSAAILAQNRRHTARIIEAADDLHLHLVTPRSEASRGGSLMLRMPADAAPLVAELRENGIFVDARGPILRLSPGPITTDTGVEALIAGLTRHAKG